MSRTSVSAATSSSSSLFLNTLYVAECQKLKCKPNTELVRLFSATPASALCLLDLSKNMLGPYGIIPFLNVVLPNAANLKALALPHNTLGNEAVLHLCDALLAQQPPAAAAIAMLDLSHNPISHAGGKRLLQLAAHAGVGSGGALRSIALEGTLINVALIGKIHAALRLGAAGEFGAAAAPVVAVGGGKGAVTIEVDDTETATPASPPSSPAYFPADKSTSPTTTAPAAGQPSFAARQPVALVSPAPMFLALRALHLALLELDKSSATGFTPTENDALALLHKASRECPQPSPIADGLGSVTPRRQSLGAAIVVATGGHGPSPVPLATSNAEHHVQKVYVMAFYNILSVMLDIPSKPFPAVQLLLRVTTRNLAAKVETLPALELLRGGEVERRDGSRIAVNILLSSAFGDPLPVLSDLVTHSPETEETYSREAVRRSSVASSLASSLVAHREGRSADGSSPPADGMSVPQSTGTGTPSASSSTVVPGKADIAGGGAVRGLLDAFVPPVPLSALAAIFDVSGIQADPEAAARFGALVRLQKACSK